MDTTALDVTAVAEQSLRRIRKHYPALAEIAKRYRDEASFRSRIDSGDAAEVLDDLGLRVPPGIEVRLVPNTPEDFHVVLPPNPNVEISDEALSTLSAGGKCVGSAATVGTVGTATGTVGTVGTVGSAGSAVSPVSGGG